MPWHKVQGHGQCPTSKPWAVVKDSDGSVAGCHASESDADDQLAALYANEGASVDTNISATSTNTATPPLIVRLTPGSTIEAVTVVDETAAAAPADCPPGHHSMPDGSCMPDEDMAMEQPDAEVAAMTGAEWYGVLTVEGVETGDGRVFAENALEWRTLPLPMYWQRATSDGHKESVIVGNITDIWRDGNMICGKGMFNLSAAEGSQNLADATDAFQLVRDGFMRGISVTVDNVKEHDVEMIWPEEMDSEGDPLGSLFMEPETIIFHRGRIIDGTLTGQPALQEAFIQLGTPPEQTEPVPTSVVAAHSTTTVDDAWDAGRNFLALPLKFDQNVARAAFAWVTMGDVVAKADCKFLHHNISANGLAGAANLTACSAAIGVLNGARGGVKMSRADRLAVYNHLASHLRDAGREPMPLVEPDEVEAVATLTAAMTTPVAPPAIWFTNPHFTDVTPLQVGDDGFVRGHLARWGTCHTSFTSTCVTPPFEEEFSFFTTGEIKTREGTRVPVGQLTVGTGHAPTNLGARPAAVHYDHTGYAVADVAAGADEFGIWVAGALCPDVDEVTIRRLRASALSGDWRRIGGQLRLVAALVVNVPGFPIPRTKTHTHDGAQTTLVASGVIPNTERTVSIGAKVSRDMIERIAKTIGRDTESRRKELSARVHGLKAG